MPREVATDRFAHLHVHSEYSSLDGLGSVKEYVARAAELGQPALAMTDHGGVWGLPEFYHECRRSGVEPVLGEEFYYVEDSTWRPLKGSGEQAERYHVTVLAKGAEGYLVLSELSTAAHARYWYKPLLDDALLDSLDDDARHLVVLSGCATSRLSKLVQDEDMEEAAWELMKWREWFPHYYVELMHHDTNFDKRSNEGLVELARRFGVPWVITNDPHYVVPEDHAHHDALLAIQTASDIDDPERFRFDGDGYHLRTRKEMRRAFRSYGDEVWKPGARETLRVARLCRTRIPSWENRTWHIPGVPGIEDPYRTLKRLAYDGLRARGLVDDPDYAARTKHELRVIKQAGIAAALLITEDALRYARSVGIPVGPGRGSVCGTLVGYLAGIHKIDPLRYRLRFDRFLNPARPRMPDIDSDFGRRRRSEIFDYMTERYSEENVVHVCIYFSMRAKKAFKTLAKAYGYSFNDRERLAKLILEDEDDEGSTEFVLPKEVTEAHPELEAQMNRLVGVKAGVGAHPAGVLIADPEYHIRSRVPLMWIPSSKRWVGQFDLNGAEELGLMKQDFLGLTTLDVIADCIELVRRRRGIELDPDSWVPDEEERDDEVYAMLAAGDTAGVFQMTGATNTRGCREVQPASFEDIVSITSLYRTGPIKAKFPEQFVENRLRGRRNIPYVHPALKPILKDTWGVILYQEQVMDIGERIAGFDMALVDDIKEAIKHKRGPLMVSLKPLFIKGTKATVGMSRKVATALWEQIEGYSGYSYNRSHAVAYSMLTYQTARLKLLYPEEFTAALLRNSDDDDKRTAYLRMAVARGIDIMPPDINLSDAGATPHPTESAIMFGLQDLTGIGPKQAFKLLAARPRRGYRSMAQVAEAARNKGVVAVLAASACESLGRPRDLEATERLLKWQLVDRMVKYRRKYADRVLLPSDAEDDDVTLCGMIEGIDRRTTKNGKPFVTWTVSWDTATQFDIRLWSETGEDRRDLWNLRPGSVVLVRGRWEPKWENLSVANPHQIKVIKAVR